MENIIYKSLISSLVLTNIWSIITFFIYYFESPGLFRGFDTFSFFLMSCWITAGIGILSITLSFVRIWKSNQKKIFLLSINGFLNLFFSILLILTAFLGIINFDYCIINLYLICNFLIPIIILLIIKKKLERNGN